MEYHPVSSTFVLGRSAVARGAPHSPTAAPANLPADNRPHPALLPPTPGSAGRYLPAPEPPQGRAPVEDPSDLTDARALTPPERQALLVGLNDARNKHKVRAPVAPDRRTALLRLILGHTGFPSLADPHLEALRALAMRLGACRDRLDAKEAGHALDTPLLVSAARFVREQSKGEPPTTFSPTGR